jgi:hypothetical protein
VFEAFKTTIFARFDLANWHPGTADYTRQETMPSTRNQSETMKQPKKQTPEVVAPNNQVAAAPERGENDNEEQKDKHKDKDQCEEPELAALPASALALAPAVAPRKEGEQDRREEGNEKEKETGQLEESDLAAAAESNPPPAVVPRIGTEQNGDQKDKDKEKEEKKDMAEDKDQSEEPEFSEVAASASAPAVRSEAGEAEVLKVPGAPISRSNVGPAKPGSNSNGEEPVEPAANPKVLDKAKDEVCALRVRVRIYFIPKSTVYVRMCSVCLWLRKDGQCVAASVV